MEVFIPPLDSVVGRETTLFRLESSVKDPRLASKKETLGRASVCVENRGVDSAIWGSPIEGASPRQTPKPAALWDATDIIVRLSPPPPWLLRGEAPVGDCQDSEMVDMRLSINEHPGTSVSDTFKGKQKKERVDEPTALLHLFRLSACFRRV